MIFREYEEFYLTNNTSNCSLVFVFNNINDPAIDNDHKSECVYPDEIEQIADSFRRIENLEITLCPSEQIFIDKIEGFLSSNKEIYVYSMAQNIENEGRRCLVPLLCQYYGFTNISGTFKDSFLSGNKQLMTELLTKSCILMPQKYFFSKKNRENWVILLKKFSPEKVIIKPNCESASIGVIVITLGLTNYDRVITYIEKELIKYDTLIVEQFIDGVEIECTVIKEDDKFLVLPVVEIIKDKSIEYLDYETVKNNLYDYKLYNHFTESISMLSSNAFTLLGFNRIGRFDYIITGKSEIFLFDITANPTISEYSSTNFACESYYSETDSSLIYRLLFFLSYYSNHRSQTV